MKRYRIINNIVGWMVFAVAAVTYCLTVEPSAPFWDCPEFTTTAARLEVGHPPGAPFFMLTGNFFSHFASDSTQVAYMVNIMSAILSAFCILFLFWSVTHLVRRLIIDDAATEIPGRQLLVIMASGVAAALAYTWSDTFWFSAVESEVYAYSSMFTALVFWLILKWEECADQPRSDRWLVLIFYLTGLSIGVHLLNLLCLPAIVLVYYYKRYPNADLKGSLLALGVSVVLVAAVLYGIVPGIVKVGGWFELAFVNGLGLPFNSGMVFYIFVLVAVVLSAIWATTKKNRLRINILYLASVALLGIPFYGDGYVMQLSVGVLILALLGWVLTIKDSRGEYLLRKRVLNTSLLCMLMLMIGYSTYAVIVIRSTQNTPMDQNSPEDIFSLGTYLNREQYGSRPLFYGEAYTSRPIDIGTETRIQRHENTMEEQAAGAKDRYDIVEVQGNYVYPSAMKMLFPRMYSAAHEGLYKQWLGGITTREVSFDFERNGEKYTDIPGEMPSQWDNIRFFLSYQVNFMYWRYFMWNFAGRQNDIQGHGEYEHGNWITGFSFIDNGLYGKQEKLPQVLRENKGHNVFYCLPLLLGLLGLFWQAFRGKRGIQQFWIVFFLFFMTGLAIVLYLNQTPNQPRERDYAYAGSFYAFAMWIGFGVAAIVELPQMLAAYFERKWNHRLDWPLTILAAAVALAVPLQMVSQTWDDHDRSGRTTCRDFGSNYLNTLDEKGYPIIFTNGDNDTFPLWYAQDTEGIRTDARVCNLSYLQTDWYTDQMRRPAWKSPALPITWERYEYVDNVKGFGPDGDVSHDIFYVENMKAQLDELKKEMEADPELVKKYGYSDPYDLRFIIDNFVRNPELSFIPTDSIVVHIDRDAVIRSGMMLPNGPDSIPEHFSIALKKQRVTKSEMMVYELLARHNWVRPLYMSVTLGPENYAGLDNHLVLEGLASRVTPFEFSGEAVDTEKMYENFMKKFRFGGIDRDGIYLDQTILRMCQTHRSMFVQLIGALIDEGKTDKALKALEHCKRQIPSKNVPYEVLSVRYDYDTGRFCLPSYWHRVGKDAEAERVLLELGKTSLEYMDWYNSLSNNRIATYGTNIERHFLYLQAVVAGLKECGSKKAAAYEKKLMAFLTTRAGGIVRKRYEERYMQNYGFEDYEEDAE